MSIPQDAIPVLNSDGSQQDDKGKRVIVNSIGGPSWPDNKWKRPLENVSGTVVWGPCKLRYNAISKVLDKNGKPVIKKGEPVFKIREFITEPYWNILLDGYNRELMFIDKEICFTTKKKMV